MAADRERISVRQVQHCGLLLNGKLDIKICIPRLKRSWLGQRVLPVTLLQEEPVFGKPYSSEDYEV